MGFDLIVVIGGVEASLPFNDCHEAKSMGGKLFHADNVTRVQVFGQRSRALYLQLIDGHEDANVSISSSLAPMIERGW